jgi:hypothetical protein
MQDLIHIYAFMKFQYNENLKIYWSVYMSVFICIYVKLHVTWVPCHHGMAHPKVADGGDALQFWRVAVNILNM